MSMTLLIMLGKNSRVTPKREIRYIISKARRMEENV